MWTQDPLHVKPEQSHWTMPAQCFQFDDTCVRLWIEKFSTHLDPLVVQMSFDLYSSCTSRKYDQQMVK